MNDTAVTPIRMTKKLRNRLCEISDHDCILLKFLNRDEDEYAVGFASWLKDYQNDDFDVTSFVKESLQTITYWPLELSVQPSKVLTKFLASAKFYEEPVILLSSGDWTTMKLQLKSIETTGVLDISRKSRKRVMKKPTTSPTKPCQSKKKALLSAKATAQDYQNQEILSKQPKLDTGFGWDSIEQDDGNYESINKNQSAHSKNQTDDSGLGDIDDATDNTALKARKYKGNKKLNQTHAPEDIIASNNKKQSYAVSPTKTMRPRIKASVTETNTIVSRPKTFSPPASPATPKKKTRFRIDVSDGNSEEEDDWDKSNDDSGNNGTLNYETFEYNLQNNRSSAGNGSEKQGEGKTPTLNLPAGVKRAPPLPDQIIKMCLTTRKLQNFVSGLADNFFEKSYLAAHSPTGKIPNALKGLGIEPKPRLHPQIVEYIRELAAKYFGSQVGVQGKVTKALSDKISSARPKKKGQATATGTGKED